MLTDTDITETSLHLKLQFLPVGVLNIARLSFIRTKKTNHLYVIAEEIIHKSKPPNIFFLRTPGIKGVKEFIGLTIQIGNNTYTVNAFQKESCTIKTGREIWKELTNNGFVPTDMRWKKWNFSILEQFKINLGFIL